ncbi:MAG TPA: DUF362 domain-containing protein [Aggregatilineaceae bacterium]|nr:DUF362 domain-containing protein [Aggregatilineaceae bacterium]
MHGLTRRHLLRLFALLASGRALRPWDVRSPENSRAQGVSDLARGGSPATAAIAGERPRVVQVHAPGVTDWDFGASSYLDHIDQAVVSRMVDEGLARLTGAASRAEAWQALLPEFSAGQRIAIKVNFNNYIDGSEGDAINAVIEPVNALVAGLLERGFAPADITVYDMTNAWHAGGIPPRFVAGCAFPGVRFEGYLDSDQPYSEAERVHFSPPAWADPVDDLPLARPVVEADYLINLPIVKSHSFAGVTLGFKNHFGSIEHCDRLHVYTPGFEPNAFDPQYSPVVDLNRNPHIRAKTALILGDCLFGGWMDPISKPQPWASFGNRAPASLFFGRDPLATECVMADLLAAETALLPETDGYLRLAAAAGLGVYERADPWQNTYRQIDFVRVELDS